MLTRSPLFSVVRGGLGGGAEQGDVVELRVGGDPFTVPAHPFVAGDPQVRPALPGVADAEVGVGDQVSVDADPCGHGPVSLRWA